MADYKYIISCKEGERFAYKVNADHEKWIDQTMTIREYSEDDFYVSDYPPENKLIIDVATGERSRVNGCCNLWRKF